MSVWMELYCDIRSENCRNHSGAQVMDGFGSNTAKGVAINLSRLKKIARDRGWKRSGLNWVCPVCQKYLK